jgi:hypothetical protein
VSGGGAAPPPGYVRGRRGVAELVARADVAAAIETALATSGTLYDYAARHPAARAFQGRAPAYAAPLPGGGLPVVVRHSWHGGLLAPLTGDRFLRPTRAGAELAAAVRLAESGVPTPELVAYVLDVDRVRFGAPGDRRIDAANAARVLRSVHKRCALGLAHVDDAALAPLAARARVRPGNAE